MSSRTLLRPLVFPLLAFSLLFSSYRWNVFGIEQELRTLDMGVDGIYIVPAMHYFAGDRSLRGYVGEIRIPLGSAYKPYVMSVGLHRIVYSLLSPADSAGIDASLTRLRALIEAALALTLTLFLLVVRREFGAATAAVTLVSLSLSDWLVVFAPDLFWVSFLFFLPFVLVWLLGDPDRAVRQQQLLAILFTLACFLKCLCGYDYITNIFGAAAVPLLYYGFRKGVPLKRTAARIARYGLLSLLAFGSAVLLQLAQFQFIERNRSASLGEFLKEVHRRTLTNGEEGLGVGYDRTALALLHRLHGPAFLERYIAPLTPLFRYIRYLGMGAVSLPFGRHHLQLPIVLFIAGFLLAAWMQRDRLRQIMHGSKVDADTAWLASTLAALFVSHLWIVAANGHMTHTFFNAIVFYIPFLPMVYVLVARTLVAWVKR